MTPEVHAFWDEARIMLRELYGQKGKRNRQRLASRKQLSEQLGLDHKTLKSFLNANQIGLGATALNRLFDLYPALRPKYMKAAGFPDELARSEPSEHDDQLALPFDIRNS